MVRAGILGGTKVSYPRPSAKDAIERKWFGNGVSFSVG